MESFFEDNILYICAGEEKRVPGKILIAFVEVVSFSLLLSWGLASSAQVHMFLSSVGRTDWDQLNESESFITKIV